MRGGKRKENPVRPGSTDPKVFRGIKYACSGWIIPGGIVG
jgi:hypothetical protein